MPNNLAVFDVDGTLTDTAAVDEACFLEALRLRFGLDDVDSDWSIYSDFTDSIIIRELFERRLGRQPTDEEISSHIESFVCLLEEAHGREPERFPPIAGAQELIARLRSTSDWSFSIATGGWGRSARLKLGYAGLGVECAPLASADDAGLREDIVRVSIRLAEEENGAGPFDRIVLVGDTIWDLRTAARMGLPFLGVAEGDRAQRLLERGACAVVANLEDSDRVLMLLTTAAPPGPGADGRSPTEAGAK